jgi:putative phosphoribosyl transferase
VILIPAEAQPCGEASDAPAHSRAIWRPEPERPEAGKHRNMASELRDGETPLTPLNEPLPVEIGAQQLKGLLGLTPNASAIVVFVHGGDSSRFSQRNAFVANHLRRSGFATLLLDLLTPHEERAGSNVFDIALLAQRVALATEWVSQDERTRDLPIGCFGAGAGVAAALAAASLPESRVRAIISRGGRPDLAAATLAQVRAATLLIVGGLDTGVIELNRGALERMNAPKELVIVPEASHLFEEPHALEQVAAHAVRWCQTHLSAPPGPA